MKKVLDISLIFVYLCIERLKQIDMILTTDYLEEYLNVFGADTNKRSIVSELLSVANTSQDRRVLIKQLKKYI